MNRSRVVLIVFVLVLTLGVLTISLVFAGNGGQERDHMAEEQIEILAKQKGDSDYSTFIAPKSTSVLTCAGGSVPVAMYFNDFESNAGGWVVSNTVPFDGEWEWGEFVPGAGELCDGARTEPITAFSGLNLWATNLDGCYSNSDGETILSQIFDFSNLSAPIELDWWNFFDVFGPFDAIEVYANGDLLWTYTDNEPTPDWQQEMVDLSSYAGLESVNIEFLLHSSTVVNRAGWYVDDLSISFCAPQDEIWCNSGPVSFESGLPALWSTEVVTGPVYWTTTADGIACSEVNETGGSGDSACADSEAANSSGHLYDTSMTTNLFDLSGFENATLDLQWRHRQLNSSVFDVDVSVDDGLNWNSLISNLSGNPSGASGDFSSLDLAPYVGEPTVTVRFSISGNNRDYYAQVDDVSLSCIGCILLL